MDKDVMEKTFLELRGTRTCTPDALDFREAVWREIRHRRALGGNGTPARLAILWRAGFGILFPRAAVLGFAAAIVVALTVGAVWMRAPAPDRASTAARMLDLDVFGPQAGGLAHNNLIVKR